MAFTIEQLGKKQKSGIIKAAKSANEYERKAGEKWDELLTQFQVAGVEFKDCKTALVECYIDAGKWPNKAQYHQFCVDTKKGYDKIEPANAEEAVGVNKASEMEHVSGQVVNRFGAHHGKFQDYGELKPKVTEAAPPAGPPELAPILDVDKEVVIPKSLQDKETTRTSEAHAVDHMAVLQDAFQFMMMSAEANKNADQIAMLTELGQQFGVYQEGGEEAAA